MISQIKDVVKTTCILALGTLTSLSIAGAAGYDHKDWPVTQVEPGIYKFSDDAKVKPVSLCAAFYTADINVMKENATSSTQTGQIVYTHALEMQAVYTKNQVEGTTSLEELIKDMTWHFGNAAQYGVYQEFKDSANSACENFALDNDLITIDAIIAFNDKLLASLAR